MLPSVNRGAFLLNEAVKAAGNNQSQVARELGYDQSYVSRVVKEDREPGKDFMRRCKEVLGIPMDAWAEIVDGDTELAAS